MRIYRLSQFSVIDGMGGMHAAGRWHTIGRRVFYAAEHPALALVEVLAHFRVSLDRMPINFRMVAIEVAAGAIISPEPDLPHNWSSNEATSQAVGDAWLDSNAGLLLPVPSAIVNARNYVVNAAHPQAPSHLRVVSDEPFWFDPRLARSKAAGEHPGAGANSPPNAAL